MNTPEQRVGTAVAPPVAAPAEPARRTLLRGGALNVGGGDPVREFRLIPFGLVETERACAGGDFEFTPAQAESAQRWFAQLGRKLAIDYEHQSFDGCNPRPDGLRPAAGWIGGLEVRDDGLWAVDVSWTDRARELLRRGEYRYFSPVIFWADAEHTAVAALGPVALTNDPAMHGVPALAARCALHSAEAPANEVTAAPACPACAVRGELCLAQEQLAVLQRRLAGLEAEAFLERGVRAGKVVESNRAGWRAEFLRQPELAEQLLGQAPVVLPPGCVVGRAAAPRAAAHLAPSANGGSDSIEPEDFAAYAQAVAAGRVVQAGPLM